MKGRRAGEAETLTTAGSADAVDLEQTRSARRAKVLELLEQTVDDVAASGRAPDVGFTLKKGSGLFSRSGGQRQVRGWVYDSVVRRDRGARTGRTYHAVLENGLFVITSTGSGLIPESEYRQGRKLGPKSFGYVNFAAGYVHFNTTRDAISLLKQMRRAFELSTIEVSHWRS